MRIMTLLLISLFLTSCSSQFAYRHLDWIIFWYSDDYLELDRQQERLFETELKHILLWHKKSELPKYQTQLHLIQHNLTTLPLNRAVIDGHISSVLQHWQRVRHNISERFLPLANKLHPNQIHFLFEQLEKRNQERLDDHSEMTQAEIIAEKLEESSDNLIELLGYINHDQQALLDALMPQLHDLTQLRVEYLRRYQAQLKHAMLDTEKPNDLSSLQTIFNRPDTFKSDIYLQKQNENRKRIVTFIESISKHFDAKQVDHLQNELQEYIDMIDNILEDS